MQNVFIDQIEKKPPKLINLLASLLPDASMSASKILVFPLDFKISSRVCIPLEPCFWILNRISLTIFWCSPSLSFIISVTSFSVIIPSDIISFTSLSKDISRSSRYHVSEMMVSQIVGLVFLSMISEWKGDKSDNYTLQSSLCNQCIVNLKKSQVFFRVLKSIQHNPFKCSISPVSVYKCKFYVSVVYIRPSLCLSNYAHVEQIEFSFD